MKNKLKSEKGIIATDALIAIMLIVLFSGLILTLGYNIYLSNAGLKRISTATKYITDVFEYVDQEYYDDVTENTLETYSQGLAENIYVGDSWNGKGYKIHIEVENYNEEDNTRLDLVKTIRMTVTYKLAGKEQHLEMTRIKKRENLITPNKPNINLINKEETQNVYPIKHSNSAWIVTDINDANWYNYEKGNWATVIVATDVLAKGQEVELEDYDVLVWVPKYAYDSINNEVEFLFQNTNKYIDKTGDYDTLQDIDTENYTIENINNTGKWIETADVINENLDNVFEMNI